MRAYRIFIISILVALAYFVGGLSGYAIGYNDNYAEKVVKYKKIRHYKGF